MLKVYGRSEPYCPKCEHAKTMLNAKGVDFEYVDLSVDKDAMSDLVGREIPQIFSGAGEYIGDLRSALKYVADKGK